MGDASADAPAISSRILNLKFMQRHAAFKGQELARGAASKSQPQQSDQNQAAGPSDASKWRLDLPARLGATTQAVVMTEAPEVSGPHALLQFRAGRRSFGKFNPKLETRLADIGTKKREAATELAEAAAAEAWRVQQAVEYAELMARADASEEVERRSGVSEEEMAMRYAKYVPTTGAVRPAAAPPHQRRLPAEPPEVARPVQVTDAPIGAAGTGVKRKAGGGSGGGSGERRARPSA